MTEELCVINGEDPNYGLLTGCGYTAGNQTFTYDQVGNRTDLGGVTGTGNRIQSFNGITFFHDADGNIIQKYKNDTENRVYWWSAEARLDSAQQGNWSKVRYDYDAQGRPVRKWRGDPVNGWLFDRLWVYDGDQRLVSLDPSMNRVEEYAYAPGIDRPIATIRGNTGVDAVGYHVQDELGNILGIIENGAYISQTNSYDAWGTPTETGHAYNNQLKWKGLKWEGDVISLYYMRNRWCDYETGRFMSEDPIGLAGGINLYAFANNDPVNGQDPYGLCQFEYGYTYYRSTGQYKPGSFWIRIIPGSCDRDRGWSDNFGNRGGGWMDFTGYGDENWNGGNGPGGGGAVQEPATNPKTARERPVDACLAADPLFRIVAPLSALPLLNLKLPGEWETGASRWTTIDRRLPPWMGAKAEAGAQVHRGTLRRAKYVGRLGTAAVAIGGFSTAYAVTALVRCRLEN